MSLATDYALRSSAPFQQRIASAIVIAAANIKNEDSGTANHANRDAWARRLKSVSDVDGEAARMVIGVASNASISANFAGSADQTTITDGDIQFTVNSLVDTYAP